VQIGEKDAVINEEREGRGKNLAKRKSGTRLQVEPRGDTCRILIGRAHGDVVRRAHLIFFWQVFIDSIIRTTPSGSGLSSSGSQIPPLPFFSRLQIWKEAWVSSHSALWFCLFS